jgi:glycerophosphoryl diester phosphodiesterase
LESRSKWTQSSRSAPDPLDPGPAGFAHRGLHSGAAAPENSLAAFAAALEFGAGIECDLRLTRDDEVVLFHDPDALRLCGSPLRIGRSNLAELAHLRVGGHFVANLNDLLELVGGRAPLLLEVKVQRDLGRWTKALTDALANYRGPFGVMSFDPRLPGLLKAKLPNVRRGLVIETALPAHQRKLALALASPQFVAVEQTALGQPWVAAVRREMPVYAWTIASPEERGQAQVQADALIWEADGGPRI